MARCDRENAGRVEQPKKRVICERRVLARMKRNIYKTVVKSFAVLEPRGVF